MSDPEWVFEYMCEVLNSPTWEVPVLSFIDETCVVFDNEDENKLAHMDAHADFKQLIEGLMLQHLTEVGISADDFYEACEVAYKQGDKTDFAKQVIEHLIACDDFLTFKSLMVKRNKELEMEALMTLEAEEEVDFTGEEKADAELAAAISLSEETARLVELSAIEKEQAEVEQAIAMSIAMEEERIRLLQEKGGDESKSNAESKESKSDEESKRDPMCSATALPPIGRKSAPLAVAISNLDVNKKAFDTMMSSSKQNTSLSSSSDQYDELDVARRKKHLEAQRKKLIAKKNAQRAAKLKEFEEQKRDTPKHASGKPAKKKISSDQGHLTYALARRMKQDLLEDSENESYALTNGDSNGVEMFSNLDAKLKKVEQLRQQKAELMRS